MTNEPANATRWQKMHQPQLPPDDMAILAPYHQTKPGFERLFSAACGPAHKCFKHVDDGCFELCLWDIWEKEKDPADSDQDKRRINEMQKALEPLDDDTRFIRIQIAMIQRCFWTFPGNVDLVIQGIAQGRPNLDAAVSCEPPWADILGTLRHRRGHPGSPFASRHQTAQTGYDPHQVPREKLLRAYMTIMHWWSYGAAIDTLQHDLPEHADLAQTIYDRLGQPTPLKRLYVHKLMAVLGCEAFPESAGDDNYPQQAAVQLSKIFDELLAKHTQVNDKIRQMIDDRDLCHHAFFRHLDRQIANIGANDIVPLPSTGQKRKFVLQTVTNYIHVLASWLAARDLHQTVNIWPDCRATAQKTFNTLDKPTPLKRWLLACLWKQLCENQAQHCRGAIDDDPKRFALPADALT